jgi:small GTP-binding protein
VIVLQKKICMLGAVGVGKTSLVRRFVESLFSESYQPTVGVKIDRKTMVLGEATLNLMLWDLQGEADHQRTRMEYLRGSAGYLLVADGTRRASLSAALDLARRAAQVTPNAAMVLVVNKMDLEAERDVSDAELATLVESGLPLARTSARTGAGVEAAFRRLAEQVIAKALPAAEES